MSTYLIMYDLNKEGAAYYEANKKLTDRIKEKFPIWWHHLDSTWIVVTDLDHTQIRDDLKKYIDSDDELLVVKSSGTGAWTGFNGNGSGWLKKNL
ncbi:hypothetical protein QE419_002648 [Brevundimonas vesicularis]|uniref:hypothetical protein n=1 Tax=Brevundimonas vesicularis TaxID=41276 RepID=UPI0027813715|nr:hypothetical protein [Brevundimonas vesicularis]MDQ1193882.1 hypothetical protein [Brevundimonas vesicularis]